MRVARGIYVAVTANRLGPVLPPVDKMVQSLAIITGCTVVCHGEAVANALGLTTPAPLRQVYLTDGRARSLSLVKQIIKIRHAAKWMLVLGDSPASDVASALEWLGPHLAEQAVSNLAGRIGQDDWRVILGIRHLLPVWMVESRCGVVAVGPAYLFPSLSSDGA